ncbi:MAG TPA: NlpC/P60 family protein [Pyrinomonadaceae bacterium]|jgi:cell wall-associated NlpC family hydrolase
MKALVLLILIVSTTSFSLFKPKPVRIGQLRDNYIQRLLSYRDAPYAPYGSDTGISCSTLVREALLESSGLEKKARTDILANSCSSRDLNEGCHGELSVVADASNLNSVNYDKIQPGDIAVVGYEIGIHTLAYLGDKQWIHADPIAEKVIVSDVRDNNGYWFNMKARILRWKALNGK